MVPGLDPPEKNQVSTVRTVGFARETTWFDAKRVGHTLLEISTF